MSDPAISSETPPFDEEPWEADVSVALRSLPPVEPPAGFLEHLGHDELARRRAQSRIARPLLIAAAAVVVVGGLVGVLRVFADRDASLEINELVARHDELAAEASSSADVASGTRFPADLVESAARVGKVPSGWSQDVYLRGDEVVSLFVPTATATVTIESLSESYGDGRVVAGELRTWRLPVDSAPEGLALVVADRSGLVAVVGLSASATQAFEARLDETPASEAGSAVAMSRQTLTAEGFAVVGS